MLDAIGGSRKTFSLAADLAAVQFAFAELAEVLLEPGKAIGAEGRRSIDFAQAARRRWLRPAQDHAPRELLGPNRQPEPRAVGALAELLPFSQLDHGPLHDPIVLDAGPGGPRAAGTGR